MYIYNMYIYRYRYMPMHHYKPLSLIVLDCIVLCFGLCSFRSKHGGAKKNPSRLVDDDNSERSHGRLLFFAMVPRKFRDSLSNRWVFLSRNDVFQRGLFSVSLRDKRPMNQFQHGNPHQPLGIAHRPNLGISTGQP